MYVVSKLNVFSIKVCIYIWSYIKFVYDRKYIHELVTYNKLNKPNERTNLILNAFSPKARHCYFSIFETILRWSWCSGWREKFTKFRILNDWFKRIMRGSIIFGLLQSNIQLNKDITCDDNCNRYYLDYLQKLKMYKTCLHVYHRAFHSIPQLYVISQSDIRISI